MARFARVDLYPFTGFTDDLWDSLEHPPGDPLRDAVLRAAPAVTALYAEALAHVDVTGPRAWLLISLTHGRTDRVIELAIWSAEPDDGPERGFVTLCPEVGRLDARGRAHLVLDVVHAGVVTLASARGWDPRLFDACRQHVVDRDFTYRWTSPWKSSPDRRHQARAAYTLGEPDGFGRVRLEVRRRGEGDSCEASPPAIAYCHAPRFARSAATLAWDGSDQVGLDPFVGAPGGRGEVRGRLDEGAWSFAVRDDVSVRAPGGDGITEDPTAPLPAVVATLT